MKLLVFLLFFNLNCLAQSLSLEGFVEELSARQSRVEEFKHIKRIATELGIDHVYMFGGTAAAWGHYVRWDMRRELGIEDLQPHRFDYDYTNIFRANQDFDVVIDGTVEQAEALESAVQKQFNYFSGTRPTWEVRLLNEKRLDKDSIMGADFQNQHTDSHSTGLIEMMDCEGFDCVKDVRDMKNPRSVFLKDLYEAKLHYYFSKKHSQTSRFKSGMNPPILSVVRYFTKVVQYELKQRPADIKILEKIIREFNPSEASKWDSYVIRWLEKNAKKLIVNAVDMEYAQKLIEKNGLKKKLMNLSNREAENSMAWWLNKESLKSYPLGQGGGKTAGELFEPNENGEIIVAHETNSFPAFESITKAHDGEANVLISRDNIAGEAALHGDGHYTRIGRFGARNTGLTIRYRLNPLARENSDFTKSGDFVIVNNKKALEVIYESIELDTEDYFYNLINGIEFDSSDRGVVEKLKRKMRRRLNLVDDNQLDSIYHMVNEHLESEKPKLIVLETWLSLNDSYKYPDILNKVPYIGDDIDAFIDQAREITKFTHLIDKHVLTNPNWLKVEGVKEKLEGYLQKNHPLQLPDLIKMNVLDNDFWDWTISDLFNKRTYINFEISEPSNRHLREKLLNRKADLLSRSSKDLIAEKALKAASLVAPQSSWGMVKPEIWFDLNFHHEYPEVGEAFFKNMDFSYFVKASKYSLDFWTDDKITELVNLEYKRFIAKEILSQERFLDNPNLDKWVQIIMNSDDTHAHRWLFQSIFVKNPRKYMNEIREFAKDRTNAGHLMTSLLKNNPQLWVTKPDILWNVFWGERSSSYNESINKGWHWKLWVPLFIAYSPLYGTYRLGKYISNKCNDYFLNQ